MRLFVFCLAALALFCSSATSAQQTETITEPARVGIEDLFKQADVVATVRIVSGNTEHYSHTVYKAEVLKAFKGVETGAKIFFGPYVSYGLGSEYLVFLHRSAGSLSPKPEANSQGVNYGVLQLSYDIMYEGYSVMPVAYTCVFGGKEISEHCDNGIQINTYQVILRGSIRTSPPERDDATSTDKKWVRKDAFLAFLDKLK